MTAKSYEEEIRDWHASRMARLKADGGWLSLAGLFWLHDGANVIGSAAGSDVPFPAKAPAKVGTLSLEKGTGTLTLAPGIGATIEGKPAPATPIALHSDTDEKNGPTKITIGSLTFYLIDRGGKYAVRLIDAEAETRTSFTGIETYPIDPKWRIEARFEVPTEKKTISVPTVIDGVFEEMQVAGTARFTVDGKEYSLEPVLEQGDTDLFFIFKDATAGSETYGAGRFLYADPPKDGKVVLDFNKAYNPPCALTPFATCPLPPPENVLPIPVRAGEKKYGHGHH